MKPPPVRRLVRHPGRPPQASSRGLAHSEVRTSPAFVGSSAHADSTTHTLTSLLPRQHSHGSWALGHGCLVVVASGSCTEFVQQPLRIAAEPLRLMVLSASETAISSLLHLCSGRTMAPAQDPQTLRAIQMVTAARAAHPKPAPEPCPSFVDRSLRASPRVMRGSAVASRRARKGSRTSARQARSYAGRTRRSRKRRHVWQRSLRRPGLAEACPPKASG